MATVNHLVRQITDSLAESRRSSARISSRQSASVGQSVAIVVVVVDMVPFKNMSVETRLETSSQHVADMLENSWANVPDGRQPSAMIIANMKTPKKKNKVERGSRLVTFKSRRIVVA